VTKINTEYDDIVNQAKVNCLKLFSATEYYFRGKETISLATKNYFHGNKNNISMATKTLFPWQQNNNEK
jgi:hypothetical protein